MNPQPERSDFAEELPGRSLSEILRQGLRPEPLPDGFESGVRRRLRTEMAGLEVGQRGAWWERLLSPAPLALATGLAMVLGGYQGWADGHRHRLAMEESHYLDLLDPVHHQEP